MASLIYLELVRVVGGAPLSLWSLILLKGSPGFFPQCSQGSQSVRTCIKSLPHHRITPKFKASPNSRGWKNSLHLLTKRGIKSHFTGVCIQGKNLWLFFPPIHYTSNGSKFRNNTEKKTDKFDYRKIKNLLYCKNTISKVRR